MVALVQLVNDNWKTFLLLVLLLFYRTIRTFLEEVQEGFGMKRRPVPPPMAEAKPNPPDKP